ncbi:MAG: Metallo-beta-lactamase family protein [Hyphomicrobiales bacterium]|nr:Metallo-beta-lactamase family protein [Hyphomicrobiales bacterium]
MAASPEPLVFETQFDPQTGTPVPVAPGIVRVTAPNRSPYTFTGTNSFLLGEDRIAVVDPGPDDERHLQALLAAIAGRPVEAIVLTHTHKDHSALAPKLKAATGAPLWFEGRHRLSRRARPFEMNGVGRSSDWALVPERVLRDGEHLSAGGIDVEIIATPGHCANHIAIGVAGTSVLLSGDHVMGWSSTLVSVPDGSMADYLASLRKVIALPYDHYLPAHGGPIAAAPRYANALLAHREARNEQIKMAVAAGARSISALLGVIYPTIAPALRIAAGMTLKAHVEYLEAAGMIRVHRGLFGTRLSSG